MCHRNWRTFALLGIGGVAIWLALGFNPGFLLFLLVCPLMMFFMMRAMGTMGGTDAHSGHGCAHDRHRRDESSRGESSHGSAR